MSKMECRVHNKVVIILTKDIFMTNQHIPLSVCRFVVEVSRNGDVEFNFSFNNE